MAAYTPPVGNDIQFNFTQSGYYTPVWSAIDFDFDNSDYRAEDPATLYLPSTWRMNPTGTGYIRPYFRCTYRDINSTGLPVTDVEINVYDSDGNPMWQSGVLNFKDFLDAEHTDPPYPDRYAYDGAEIVVKYALNLTWDFDPSATVLTRDGLDYHWEMHFYVDSLGVFTTFGRGSFNMFEELWQPRDLTCEGLINPTDVTDITPEFAATLWSQYVPSVYTPSAKSYRIWVATDSGFSSVVWDSDWTALTTPITPGESTPQIPYAGTALERNGVTYYWRMRFLIDVEWAAVDATSYISDTNNYTMLLEYYRLINPQVDWLTAPAALKDYHPKFNATFSDNYSGARATQVQIQVKYHGDTWSTLKWDSDWVSLTTPVSPGDSCQQVTYPDPYPSGDEGFYYDGLTFDFRMRFEVSSDGTKYTDWTQTYSISYFTMGIANIVCVDPRVDGMSGIPRVLSFNPYFDAVYSTDDSRALDYLVYIQVATGSDMSGLVWDSGYLSFTPGISHGDRSPLEQIPEDILSRDVRYYWRIRFKNERAIEGAWSSINLFDCIGWIVSDISHNDAITFIRGSKEYEARVESKDNYIYYWLWDITDGVYLFTEYSLNVGGLPRIKYDSDADEFILIWELNRKMYKRSWGFGDSPESASTLAPQLIECTYYPVTINHEAGRNNYEYAHCPYAPTNVTIRRGTIIRWGGVDYRDGYLLQWTHAADHVLYDNTMVGEFKKHYEIYLDRLREIDTLPSQTIEDAVAETIIYSICGTEIVTKQKFLYPEHSPCQDEWLTSDYARGTLYPGRAYSILDGWGPYQQNGENSAMSTSRGFQPSFQKYTTSNVPVKQVYRYLDDHDTHIHQSTTDGVLESFKIYTTSNIPVKQVYRYLDDHDAHMHQSAVSGFLQSYNTLVTYSGGYIR